ncbi:hypothetical protein [Streptacidiphilus jiangxiensis]|nr:hypothetical protein [Streptacidiphilus jiangxiensis]
MTTDRTPPPRDRRRPVTLSRRRTEAHTEMLRRVVPAAVEDRGLSRLDIAAFSSSIG